MQTGKYRIRQDYDGNFYPEYLVKVSRLFSSSLEWKGITKHSGSSVSARFYTHEEAKEHLDRFIKGSKVVYQNW